MKLLDLFCGAGGCSVGYHRAGFEVVGVDIEPHEDYPFELHVMDWAESVPMWPDFDVIHASPPCPRFSTATRDRDRHPDLLTPAVALLRQWDGPWVVENVPGAPLPSAATLCGPAMGLPRIKRHRLFESNVPIMSPGCRCDGSPIVGVYGDHADKPGGWKRPNGSSRGTKATSVVDAQQALGIDWMTRWDDLADAIPPAYTEHIGWQLINHIAAGNDA